jgi:RNA polymerase sigma-70 factor (ECF subfamily)
VNRSVVTQEDETELLLQVARGDQEALRSIYRAFERPLYSLGVRWYGDRGLAEELVQEVTLRVWRRAETFDPAKGAARSWIFGVARNVASDLGRTKSRQPLPTEHVEEEASPWDQDAAISAWEVAGALRALPSDEQEVVELAFIHQHSHSEIASRLGIPLGTVKTRMYRGLGRLEGLLIAAGVMEAAS